MRAKFYVLVAGLGLLATAAPIMAHHSFTAEYDAAKPSDHQRYGDQGGVDESARALLYRCEGRIGHRH